MIWYKKIRFNEAKSKMNRLIKSIDKYSEKLVDNKNE